MRSCQAFFIAVVVIALRWAMERDDERAMCAGSSGRGSNTTGKRKRAVLSTCFICFREKQSYILIYIFHICERLNQ
jgi:hypothetical protein